jgi:hypothetical protein
MSSPTLQVASGAVLQVRLDRSLSTKEDRAGDRFTATLVNPVIVDGATAIPRGTRVHGVVEESKSSGRFKGRAHLALALTSFDENGQRIPISTSVKERSSRGHKRHNLAWIGGGAASGALIGGVAAGPAGAAIGAGAGTATGVVGAIVTGKKQVKVPAETLVAFRLSEPVTVPVAAQPQAQTRPMATQTN